MLYNILGYVPYVLFTLVLFAAWFIITKTKKREGLVGRLFDKEKTS